MKLFAQRRHRIVRLCTVLIAFSTIYLDPTLARVTQKEIQIKPSSDPVALTYKEWYEALNTRDLPRIIERGEAYIQSYPNAAEVAFLRRVIDFARTSLSSDRRAADAVRSEVKASIGNNGELEDLLNKILSDQLDVNTKSSIGQTALMLAAANGDTQGVKNLLRRRADVDATENSHGWTALVYAIWSENHLLVKCLLEYYPNIKIEDKEGRTALDHALATGDFEMMLSINSRPVRGISS